MLAAADFFTVEVWAPRGLVTFYIFFIIELSTRKIEIAGITTNPNEAWMMQIGRNVTDPVDGFLADKTLLILDRDSKFTSAFRGLLGDTDVERFVRSIKGECLNRMVFFGERSLRKATLEYTAHYHAERNHQGLGNRLIEPASRNGSRLDPIRCMERLGGMLRFYNRAIA